MDTSVKVLLGTGAEFRSFVTSPGGRPGLSFLISLTVSADVKQH